MELLDTSPLRDQRTMVGHWTHTSPEEVVEAWTKWVVGHPHPDVPGIQVRGNGLPVRRRNGDYSTELREHRGVALHAYVSGGRWIADCSVCNGGVPAWPGHDRGCCLDCGTIFRLEYPDEAEIREAVDALRVRPEHLRTWRPDQGEPVEQLRRENIVHAFGEPTMVPALSRRQLRGLSPSTIAELRQNGLA